MMQSLMAADRLLYVFPTVDEEGRRLARAIIKAGAAPKAILLPEHDRAALLMELIHYWEEETGQQAAYWAGSLWDIPLVRRALKALREQSQLEVWGMLQAWNPASKEPTYLAERDSEARRCFLELLDKSEDILALEAWRQLTEICRTTTLESGTLPWSLQILTKQDPAPDPVERLLVPHFLYQKDGWPRWLGEMPNVTATAARRDSRGFDLHPDIKAARHLSWSVQEVSADVTPAEPLQERSVPTDFRLSPASRLQVWQANRLEHVYSVTELETYRRCPYAYWLERIVGLRAVEGENWELTPQEVGVMIHGVLESFYQRHQAQFAQTDGAVSGREEFGADLDLLVDQAVTALQKDFERRNLLVERQVQRIKRAVRALVGRDLEDLDQQRRPLRPRYFEWSFGDAQTGPFIVEGKGGRKIKLRGKVDRIDVDEQQKTFMVLDYKTGSRKITGRDIERGDSLQLPIYIQAVQTLLLPDYTPIGGVFFSLADMSKQDGMLCLDTVADYFEFSMRSSSIMPRDKWQALLEESLGHVRETVADIEAGRFPPTEGLCSNYCPYQDMCGCSLV